ncbi:MAG: EXPERA domain-containing protein [Stenotrophobium sp.]
MNHQPIPLLQRPGDIALLLFFFISLFYVALVVDMEQLVIPDAANFTYPVWPPAFLVDNVHWYGHKFDPLQIARPAWWRACIWHEMTFGVPFYIFAIYAFIKGREWIRVPALLYGAGLITIVLIILYEERFGPYAAPNYLDVVLFNLPWLLAPAYMIYRMWRYPHPFTRPAD